MKLGTVTGIYIYICAYVFMYMRVCIHICIYNTHIHICGNYSRNITGIDSKAVTMLTRDAGRGWRKPCITFKALLYTLNPKP